MRICLLLAAMGFSAAMLPAPAARAEGPVMQFYSRYQSFQRPWHGDYYHSAWGAPVALVVPPTAERQVKWSWGVTNTEVVPIWDRYRRAYPRRPNDGGMTYATPAWPSHTDQFGVYYIRGPW